ncbi:MAG: bifunctional transaldolase/phosoglucose isomerase, partial [Bacteroidota bacterium]
FSGPRWEKLKAQGARLQRPLWASTSTKNPAYPDLLYVDNLIGPDTINTVPPATLEAFRDHGKVEITLTQGVDDARQTLDELEAQGISLDAATQEVEDEGVKAFSDSITQLLGTIEERRKAAVSQLGPLAESVARRINQLEAETLPKRMWEHDPTLWTDDPVGQAEIRIRMGWLDLPESSRAALPEIQAFAQEIRRAGIQKFLVLGMGGSSLAPEVFGRFFPNPEAELEILDSTDPAQVLATALEFPPAQSLYIVASKSGGTAEVTAAFDYFWELAGGDGSRFIAITDPGTALEALGKERAFRKIFNADPNVGGRYSALTHFGLVPAALAGVDLDQLLQRAEQIRRNCGGGGEKTRGAACRNAGVVLGAILGESAVQGRDKLTIIADEPLQSFGSWMEQLIAESSGKQGKGIIPVDLEPLGDPDVYGADRLFVHLQQTGEQEAAAARLREAGFPVLELAMPDAYSLGAEFYRWEMATATACHILGVNAFDQPDVQDAKDRTKVKIAEYQQSGTLEESDLVEIKDVQPQLETFLARATAGDYIAINAYLPRNAQTAAVLTQLRGLLRNQTKCATTLGFGPRFQHSTGQLHKGGPNSGLFLQIVADAGPDVDVPTEEISFGSFERAQAQGDYEALSARGRRILRVLLPGVESVGQLTGLL